MRCTALIALLGACGFSAGSQVDAPGPADAAPDSTDAFGGRVRQGLIALWSFNETTGVIIGETSGFSNPTAQLRLSNAVTWANGTMTVGLTTPATVANSLVFPDVNNPTPAKLLNQECVNKQGVTLEAWVSPTSANQGTLAAPVVVAGIGATVASRNIAILQAGTVWTGRVRIAMGSSDADNGGPDLVPVAQNVAGVMTHVVLVADATSRALYVNGDKIAETAPAPPRFWDDSHKIMFANELSLNRPWLGTFALVALYNRALPEAQIRLNFVAGPDAP